MPQIVNCPTCGAQVAWSQASRWRPFCSRRCRLIDLGDWLDETHRISEPASDAHAEPWPEGAPPADDDAPPRH